MVPLSYNLVCIGFRNDTMGTSCVFVVVFCFDFVLFFCFTKKNNTVNCILEHTKWILEGSFKKIRSIVCSNDIYS